MGDFFQTIVDRDATAEDAILLANRVLAWLVAEHIVEGTPTACIIGPDDLGYAPGARIEQWLDSPEEGRTTRGLKANGLELLTTKTVFYSVSTDYEAVCPRGHGQTPPAGWMDVVDEWYSSTGPALVNCPTCESPYALTDWSFEPGFAFGYLGFRFWNWPPFLSRRLIDEVGRLLAPHRIAFVYSKL